MRNCSSCGGSYEPSEGACPSCGAEPRARTSVLKLDSQRLSAVPRRSHEPAPGRWGRGDSRLPSARRSRAVAAAVPLEEPQEPEPAEVVPLRPSERPPDAEAIEKLAAERGSQPPKRPLVLASQALRRELAPATPGNSAARWAATLLGATGAAAMLMLVGHQGPGMPVAGALIALALLGIAPMPYPARAAGIATVAACGLLVSGQLHFAEGVRVDDIVLYLGVLVLGTALCFRSWHRASYLARALVALGLALCAGWLFMSHGLERLTIVETNWQAWLPRVLQLLLALTLILSLLAFMDAGTTGGARAWAWLLAVWYAAHVWVQLIGRLWPPGFPPPSLGAAATPTLIYAATPIFMTLLCIALAQLLAVAASNE